ncbi:MAG: sensor histidine kinase, partial [Bacteriovorax sp.]
ELNVIGPLPKEARFDSIRIMQALENLIANAIKYSESSSKVTIDVIVDEDRTRLSFFVKDQGPGIPETEMGKLFKEYGKTSVRPTAGESSHGLGLAIVKQVVAAHKGEVAVQSKVGVGSVFSFWIPL